MSGPIVRKYGFPNFEKIFGARAPQHGLDDEETTPTETPGAETPAEATAAAGPEPAPAVQKPTARKKK